MQPSIPLDSFDAIIFDLGGVILDLDFERTVDCMSEVMGVDASQFCTRLAQIDLFDQFERGEISEEAFRHGVRELAGSTHEFSDEELDRAWNAMIGPIPKRHIEFLQELKTKNKKRTFVLSNTNAIHAARFLSDYDKEHRSTVGRFSGVFNAVHFSHELGARKPEARAYQELIKRHHLDPSRTVFIDDNEHNIKAAAEIGLIAIAHQTNAPLPERFIAA